MALVFQDIHGVIHELLTKNLAVLRLGRTVTVKHWDFINSLLCWSVTLLMFIQTLATASSAKVRTGWPYR